MKRNTKKIRIGNVVIGGSNPVAVQSMTKTDTADWKATVAQIKDVAGAGCEIIRVAVPDRESALALGRIRENSPIPVVADIHFDWRLALEAVKQGVDKIRINPGNIGPKERVREIVNACKSAGIPIRIGINSGSLKVGSSKLEDGSIANRMAQNAVEYVKMFEDWGFTDIVISLKASDVISTVAAYKKVAEKLNYPLHIGITESGPSGPGTIKSAVGLGILLYEGIGDTLRVSLTADPVEEVRVGFLILQALSLRSYGIDLITCPTCARCKTNVEKIVKEFEKKIKDELPGLLRRKKPAPLSRDCEKPVRVAIMGCEVNGPGEARYADVGIAGGRNTGLLFMKGRPVKKLKPSEWVDELIEQIKRITG
jgi:(E)-4-hydroxy-3-methylbut-2-enyl-diphosphate synthase